MCSSTLKSRHSAGAEVVEDRILDLRRASSGWELHGKSGHYRADYLILAAGARTRLRSLFTEDFKARDFMLTFGYYVPGRDDLLRVQFFEKFEGYVWAFLPLAFHIVFAAKCSRPVSWRRPDPTLGSFFKSYAMITLRERYLSAKSFQKDSKAFRVRSFSTGDRDSQLGGPSHSSSPVTCT